MHTSLSAPCNYPHLQDFPTPEGPGVHTSLPVRCQNFTLKFTPLLCVSCRTIRRQKFLEFTEAKIRERERSLKETYESLTMRKRIITKTEQVCPISRGEEQRAGA